MSSSLPSTRQKTPRCLIFDFDGVLADSFKTLFLLNKRSLGTVGLRLSADQYRSLFDSNFHFSLNKFIGDLNKCNLVLDYRKKYFGHYYSRVKLFRSVPSMIKKLSKKYILTLASSTKPEYINLLLKRYKLGGYFKIISGSLAHSKKESLNSILRTSRTKADEAVMITDTTGDILVAKKVGLKTIAVTWGYQKVTLLKKAKPDMIAKTLKELEGILYADDRLW